MGNPMPSWVSDGVTATERDRLCRVVDGQEPPPPEFTQEEAGYYLVNGEWPTQEDLDGLKRAGEPYDEYLEDLRKLIDRWKKLKAKKKKTGSRSTRRGAVLPFKRDTKSEAEKRKEREKKKKKRPTYSPFGVPSTSTARKEGRVKPPPPPPTFGLGR